MTEHNTTWASFHIPRHSLSITCDSFTQRCIEGSSLHGSYCYGSDWWRRFPSLQASRGVGVWVCVWVASGEVGLVESRCLMRDAPSLPPEGTRPQCFGPTAGNPGKGMWRCISVADGC